MDSDGGIADGRKLLLAEPSGYEVFSASGVVACVVIVGAIGHNLDGRQSARFAINVDDRYRELAAFNIGFDSRPISVGVAIHHGPGQLGRRTNDRDTQCGASRRRLDHQREGVVRTDEFENRIHADLPKECRRNGHGSRHRDADAIDECRCNRLIRCEAASGRSRSNVGNSRELEQILQGPILSGGSVDQWPDDVR